MKLLLISSFYLLANSLIIYSQNSMVGDGFGGRLWYSPTNYTVGSYSGYSLCKDFCGLNSPQLYGWGSNITNQLGLGVNVAGVNEPTAIPNMTNVKYYSTGYIMGAIKNDNTGWAWGNTGSSTGIDGNPIQVITDVKFLDASSTTVSYIKNDGTVWSIGLNYIGNFGNGSADNNFVSIPSQMLNVNNAVRVANNYLATIILLEDSTLMSTGVSPFLGLGYDVYQTSTPLPITGIPKIIDIKSNAYGTIALTANGDVYFWGTESVEQIYTPTKISGLSNIVAISGCDDGAHFMALDEKKNCYSWGDNSVGQSGASTTTYPFIPYTSPILTATNVIDIMAGETFSYIVKSDGSLWATGQSNGGSIWLNLSDENRSVFTKLDPSVIPGSCGVSGIVADVTNCNDLSSNGITVYSFGGEEPLTFSIGGEFQTSNVFSNLDAGNYVVTVQDANGCQNSVNALITGENCPELPAIIDFPNVFSPNNDNTNDFFYFPSSNVAELKCDIINRWGNLVATLEGVNSKWDGKATNGKECSEGVYFYKLQYKTQKSDWIIKHGNVTLVR